MSSVTPSEPYNSYYMKRITELEDELKKDYRRTQEQSREQVANLERRYTEAVREVGDNADSTVERIRNDIEERYGHSREEDRAEIERIRKESYDRNGRSAEVDQYKSRLDQTMKTLQDERRSHAERIADSESAGTHKSEEMAKRYQERLNKEVLTQRESSEKAFENLKTHQRATFENQREEAVRKYELLNAEKMRDQQESRRRTETLIADSKADMENLANHLNGTIDHRLEKDHQAGIDREEQSAKDLRHSYDLQNRGLREQLGALLSEQADIPKEAARARAEVIREYEDDWRSRLEQSNSANQKEIRNLHEKIEEADVKASQKMTTQGRERDVYFAGLLAKKQTESHEEQKNIVSQYDKALKEAELRAKRDRDAADARTENALRSANENREDALKNQAEKFQQSATVQKRNDQESIDALQKQLQKKNEAKDEFDVPPAVEAAVRRSIVKQYAKNLATETERSQRAMDSMQRSYGERLTSSHEEGQAALAAHDHQAQIERHQNEVVLMEHIADVEASKQDAVRSTAQEHDRQTETINRVHAQSQTRQRNEYESILQNLRDDASSRIQTTRQEAEFAMKSQQRAFSVRENELIRQYEKKLADQKLDFDTRLEDIRNQTQQTIRDHERREKFNYEEQARTYDQRIAQLEDQRKERERSITQNYEDQLDKVKRSNALLQSKKG